MIRETMAAIRRWARHEARRYGLDREDLESRALLALAGVLHRHDPARCPHVDALLWPRLRGLVTDERRRAARLARRRPQALDQWTPQDPLAWTAARRWHASLVPRERLIVDALPHPVAATKSAATQCRRRARLHRSLARMTAALDRAMP